MNVRALEILERSLAFAAAQSGSLEQPGGFEAGRVLALARTTGRVRPDVPSGEFGFRPTSKPDSLEELRALRSAVAVLLEDLAENPERYELLLSEEESR